MHDVRRVRDALASCLSGRLFRQSMVEAHSQVLTDYSTSTITCYLVSSKYINSILFWLEPLLSWYFFKIWHLPHY